MKMHYCFFMSSLYKTGLEINISSEICKMQIIYISWILFWTFSFFLPSLHFFYLNFPYALEYCLVNKLKHSYRKNPVQQDNIAVRFGNKK